MKILHHLQPSATEGRPEVEGSILCGARGNKDQCIWLHCSQQRLITMPLTRGGHWKMEPHGPTKWNSKLIIFNKRFKKHLSAKRKARKYRSLLPSQRFYILQPLLRLWLAGQGGHCRGSATASSLSERITRRGRAQGTSSTESALVIKTIWIKPELQDCQLFGLATSALVRIQKKLHWIFSSSYNKLWNGQNPSSLGTIFRVHI